MIEIKNLTFGYHRKKTIYDTLNLSLDAGNVYGLLGTNGAGKSTLLKLMMGLLFPQNGTIGVNGNTPQKRQPSFLETIFFIPEQVYVPALTVKKYVDLYAPFYAHFSEKAFFTYLEELNVATEGKLSSMSFGQQKKFIIAFGLACNTQILLMDEPTNGLDIPSKSQFRKLIASTFTDDKLIVISTHQVRDLDQLIDNVIIVDGGSVILNASINDISEKLAFRTLQTTEGMDSVIYAESSLMGHSVIAPNTEGVDTKVNLELLFNAALSNHLEINAALTQNAQTIDY